MAFIFRRHLPIASYGFRRPRISHFSSYLHTRHNRAGQQAYNLHLLAQSMQKKLLALGQQKHIHCHCKIQQQAAVAYNA
jgi:hypothetical protein